MRRKPSLLLANLVRAGVPSELTGDSLDSESDVRTGPLRLTEAVPDDASRLALQQLNKALSDVPDSDLAATCQRFRGPEPWFREIGPWNHPIDLNRLLGRVREWKPRAILDVGDDGGGRTALWTRAAVDDARIFLAGTHGGSAPAHRMTFFNGLARARQSVRCITQTNPKDVVKRVEDLLSRRMIDLLWIDGCRPFEEVARDFETYAQLVHKGGLVGWDGIGGSQVPDPQNDGGYRLWEQVQSRFPNHAEYLTGVNLPRRGIALIVPK